MSRLEPQLDIIKNQIVECLLTNETKTPMFTSFSSSYSFENFKNPVVFVLNGVNNNRNKVEPNGLILTYHLKNSKEPNGEIVSIYVFFYSNQLIVYTIYSFTQNSMCFLPPKSRKIQSKGKFLLVALINYDF